MNIFRQNQLFWKRHPLVMGAIGVSYALVFGLVVAVYIILSPRHVGPGVFRVINGAQASAQTFEGSGDSIISTAAAAQDSAPPAPVKKRPAPRATPELKKAVATLEWAPAGAVFESTDSSAQVASNDYGNRAGQYDVVSAPTIDVDRELSRLSGR